MQLLIGLDHVRQLGHTGSAPGRPKIDQHHLALEAVQIKRLAVHRRELQLQGFVFQFRLGLHGLDLSFNHPVHRFSGEVLQVRLSLSDPSVTVAPRFLNHLQGHHHFHQTGLRLRGWFCVLSLENVVQCHRRFLRSRNARHLSCPFDHHFKKRSIPTGRVLRCDLHRHRISRIKTRQARLEHRDRLLACGRLGLRILDLFNRVTYLLPLSIPLQRQQR